VTDPQPSSDRRQFQALPRGVGMVIAAMVSIGLWVGFCILMELV
jgi:hypothetical protein